MSRYCLPKSDYFKNAIVKATTGDGLGKYFGDLGTAWWVFLVLGGISAVLGFIYLVILRWAAKPILYFSFVAILVLLIGGGFYAFFSYTRFDLADQTRNVMQGMGVLLWILAALFFVILCCCWSRIQLGAAIIQCASDFVANTPEIFIVPLSFFVLVGAWVVFWVISAIWVYSVGEASQSKTNPIIADMTWNTTTRYVWIYHLFGLFWISAFIIGCAQFIIAAVTCMWYFTHGGIADDKNRGSLSKSIKWLLRYHVGSIAFGSLIIAIMQMIKVLFEYLRKKYENLVNQNSATKCLVCCIGCCVACLDRCVKHITKNAYI